MNRKILWLVYEEGMKLSLIESYLLSGSLTAAEIRDVCILYIFGESGAKQGRGTGQAECSMTDKSPVTSHNM